MTDQPKWMPDDEQLRGDVFHAFSMEECGKSDPMAVMRDTIRSAVEKAMSEQEARHKREVLEAKISALMDFRVEIGNETGLDDALAMYLTYIRAELAALDKEASHE